VHVLALLAAGAAGCNLIFGISSGQFDPDPFGTPGDAGLVEASDDAGGGVTPVGDAAPPDEADAGPGTGDAGTDAAPDAAKPDAATLPCGLLLDDLEDGDGFIIRCSGRNGAWYTHNDGTTGGSQSPAPNVPFLPASGGYNSQFAAYTKGNGFKTAGAEMGFHFVLGTSGPQTYDLSAYTGITFEAKSAIAGFTFYVNFPDKNTCPGATNCGNTYGKSELIGTSWSRVTLPFSSLSPDPTPPVQHPFDAAHVYAIEFHAASNTSFEFWVDNVTLTQDGGP
jgi:hypothetical protein